MKGSSIALRLLALGLALTFATSQGLAAARRNLPGFCTTTLPANDDNSTGAVNIGFTINFFGTSYSQLYVNNNGNVTFTGPMSTFTPFGLAGTATPIIAPFFADVDTTGAGSGVVCYGNGTVNGRNAFGVEWPNVGYFSGHTNKLNSFELVIIDRSDTGTGNFDFEFNYDQIQWETGDASGGSNGLGGSPARVGYSNGSTTSFELSGSGVSGAFLDGGPKQLITSNVNSGVAGRDAFQARGGTISGTQTPVPGTLGLLVIGFVLVAAWRWSRRVRTA